MTIATRQLSAYALLAVPLAFASLPLYMYMPDFYATQHGMSLVTLGMILLGIRAFDAVQDPLLGVWARRWQGNPQRMHRGMVGALIVLAVGVVALMCPAEAVSPVWWFTLSMAAATTALSLVTILYQSLGALWSADYHQRTRITTAREGFTLLGVLIAVSTPALLQQYYTPAQSFVLFAVMFIALLLPAAWLWLRWLRKVSHTPMRMQALPPLMPVLRQAKGFFVVWFLSQLASAVPVVLVLFYIRDRLQLEAYTGAFLLIYFVSGAAGMPLWRAIEKRWGKKKAWQAAMAIAIFSFVWAFMLQAGDGVEYALICVFSGFALGGELAIPPSLLADQLDDNDADKHATVLFSLSTFLSKAALALASGTALLLLAGQNYSPVEPNSASALTALAFAYGLLPCLIKALALTISFFSSIGTRSIEA